MIIALAALSVIGIPFLTVMGPGAAGPVLAAITLLPALAGFAGTRLTLKPRSKTAQQATDPNGSAGRAAGQPWASAA